MSKSTYYNYNSFIILRNIFIIIITITKFISTNALFESIINIDNGTSSTADDDNSIKDNIKLSNGISMPLIGLGLGNEDPKHVPSILSASISNEYNLGYRLFDTSRVSNNERFISETISKIIAKENNNKKTTATTQTTRTIIHIVTKVWYTHLGYERTKLSIQESMNALLEPLKENPYVDLRIHVLIHWPRCYPEIEWMHCEEEEHALPQYVKDFASSPLLDPEQAWVGSWKALEECYIKYHPTIASIGVSNFGTDDLNTLLSTSNIKPHIIQVDILTLHEIWPIILEYKIIPQVFHVFHSFVKASTIGWSSEEALQILLKVAEELNIVPCTTLLSYFSQKGIVIMPRTESMHHLKQNSPNNVTNNLLPYLNENQVGQVDSSIELLLKAMREKQDEKGKKTKKTKQTKNQIKQNKLSQHHIPAHVTVTFYNSLTVQIKIVWVSTSSPFANLRSEEEEERDVVVELIQPNSTATVDSHPGHRFVAYTMDEKEIGWYRVSSSRGNSQRFNVMYENTEL